MLEYKIFREARRKLKLSLICHCSNWTLRLIHMWTKALYSALFEISQNAAICYDILQFQPLYYRWRSVSFSIVAGEFESLVPQVHQNYNEHSPSLWHNPVSIPLPPLGSAAQCTHLIEKGGLPPPTLKGEDKRGSGWGIAFGAPTFPSEHTQKLHLQGMTFFSLFFFFPDDGIGGKWRNSASGQAIWKVNGIHDR